MTNVKVRRRLLQTGKDEAGRKLVRVEGFVAGGVKWARCINAKLVKDFVAGGYVESTFIPEIEWKGMQNDVLEVFVKDRDNG